MRNYNIFKAGTIIALLLMCFGVKAQTSNVYQSAYFNGAYTGWTVNNYFGGFANNHTRLTVEAWVKTDTIPSSSNLQTIIESPSVFPAGDILNLTIMSDTLYAIYGATVTGWQIKCAYPTDTNWHHVALLCYNIGGSSGSDSLTLYIDGVYKTNRIVTHVSYSAGPGGNTVIGSTVAGTDYFKGHIARVIMVDSILYTGTFTPDCVFDSLNIPTATLTAPYLILMPLNGNDTTYYPNYKEAPFHYTYNYLTSPCAPLLTFTADTSAPDSIVNKATNTNYSYMKGAHAPTHYNGWDTSLHTTKVYCPDINYGYFVDSITVYNDTVMNYYSDYFKNTSPHHDTVTVTTTLVNTLNNADVKVYPIPANNYISINDPHFVNAEIVDLTGRSLIKSTDKTLLVHELPTGNYLLKIVSVDNVTVKKIIVIH